MQVQCGSLIKSVKWVTKQNSKPTVPFAIRKSVIGGMMAGVIGQFLANPTDLVKVQMQMEGKRKLEGKPLR